MSPTESLAEYSRFIDSAPTRRTISYGIYTGIFGLGAAFWWLSRTHVTNLPMWAPWDYSWVEFLAGWLTLFWYWSGLLSLAPEDRPSLPRRIAFTAGVLAIYAVLETRYEYLAEHQFFFNRLQHVIMHHVGPMLIALAWPGAAILRGMPARLRRMVENPILVGIVNGLQQPALAAFLFVGLIFLWLIPSIHFIAEVFPDFLT